LPAAGPVEATQVNAESFKYPISRYLYVYINANPSTGPDPLVKEFLGFDAAQQVIAFLYIGYPEHALGSYERPGFEERTVWME